ncbi:auxin-binding protein T85-like [Andrographis paniculata]|uniref:auxin-binding protein T85-like n=1 Tax=Andrographis paniculata TaxID=175694 RepID=UPI0021E78AB6|nr:auxin-binding protein T85-like [Andrographis paniculata]
MISSQLIVVYLLFLLTASAEVSYASNDELPVVRNIRELNQDGETIPGISHITVAGALSHGFKEIEVWLETVAPGGHTPVHRHDCEEIFVVVKGSGTLYLASTTGSEFPGSPKEFPFSTNSTFHVPQNDAHQVWNTNRFEDLQYFVVISRPPMNLFVYEDWLTPHSAAVPVFPVMWDAKHYKSSSSASSDEL